mmetsp:Transcript_38941/g.90824  ORF Transcript_38941/g.90824 Transcript_38941/m.90824 type:complete len:243 (+) Transcript_38941:45-773(+)
MLRSFLLVAALCGAAQGFSSPPMVVAARGRGACGLALRRPGRAIAGRVRMSDAGNADEVELVGRKKGPDSFSGETSWKLNMKLSGKPSEGGVPGNAVDVSCKVLLREDPGFEPPQGPIIILDEDNKYIGETKAFWKLDEDPSKEGFDKAGFWIWGLLEEPQYPFITFNLEIKQEIPLSEGTIPCGVIFGEAKINRSKEDGCTISDGVLKLKENVKIEVDLLGLSEGILQDIYQVGSFTLNPL